MILWHAGLALAMVWNVFRDPAIDHRLVVVGVLLPDVVDLGFGHRAYAHTLLASALVLAAVILFTRPAGRGGRERPAGRGGRERPAGRGGRTSRRRVRRRLMALPIGMFLHLVLDGVWIRPRLLWWPLFGTRFPDAGLLPPLPLLLAEEIVGAWALGWFVWRFRLGDPGRRRDFLRSGRLGALT
jgi:membrane-bound metal-dependent hydrolase YbcI (DUF457 family)